MADSARAASCCCRAVWTGTATPSRTDVTNAAISILTGPYMSGLSQYDGIGSGGLAGTDTVSSPEPPAPFATADVRSMLSTQLTLGTLPRPTFNNQFFYAVIMPAGLLTSEKNAIGEHTSFSQFGVTIPFAWVMNDGR